MVNFRNIILTIIAGISLVLSFGFLLASFGPDYSRIALLYFYITAAVFFVILDHGKEDYWNEFSLSTQVDYLPFTRKSIINRFFRYHLALLQFAIFLFGLIGAIIWVFIYNISITPKYYFFIPSSMLYTGIGIGIIMGIICSVLLFVAGLKIDDGKKHYRLAICGFFGGSIGLIFAIIIVSFGIVYLLANKSTYFSKMN